MAYNSGQTVTTSLAGTELITVDNGGATIVAASAQTIANLGSAGGTSTASIVGTETIGITSAAGVKENATLAVVNRFTGNSFTTSAQSNSTSVTLSTTFTALTYTQTSTGNTVNLKAAPVDGEIQGFSMTNIVTNLTVSSAANTVLNGAVGTTVAGQALWWRFSATGTSWYKYN